MSDRTPRPNLQTALVVALLGLMCAQASSQGDAAPRPLRLPEFTNQISDPNVVVPADPLQAAPTSTPVAPAPAPDPAVDAASPASADSQPSESRWAAKALPIVAGGAQGVGTPSTGSGAQEALEVGGSLAGVIFLIFVLRMLIRRAQNNRKSGALLGRAKAPSGVASMLARYPVGRGQQVALLAVGQRILVVHQASGSMHTLSEITDPEEVAQLRTQINGVDRESVEKAFVPTLGRMLEQPPVENALEPVDGMPGLVAETVDLTAKRQKRLVGGAA